ncbi:regulator of volume decrease after cellular swelling-domain-containing protein [Limtongia smithiae]|uniref:regulator of volume decrease after cellular swelling-domain-containing protein n=1 Tax=Limtongia smithiae TaxID=1125753 RepID=UPI0034CED173
MAITIVTAPLTPAQFRPAATASSTEAVEEAPNGDHEDAQEKELPILYYHAPARRVTTRPSSAVITGLNCALDGSDGDVGGVDVYAFSSGLLLYRPARKIGISIPFGHISVHAVQRQPEVGVYIQLERVPFSTSVGRNGASYDTESGREDLEEERDGEDYGVLELVIRAPDDDDTRKEEDVVALFEALSTCSATYAQDLSPDNDSNDDYEENIDNAVCYLRAGADADNGNEIDIFNDPNHVWITEANVDQFQDIQVFGEERLQLPVDVDDEAGDDEEEEDGRFDDAEENEDSRGDDRDEHEQARKYRRLDGA